MPTSLVKLVTPADRRLVTSGHRFLTTSGDWKSAEELTIHDQLVDSLLEDGVPLLEIHHETPATPVSVYDVVLERGGVLPIGRTGILTEAKSHSVR